MCRAVFYFYIPIYQKARMKRKKDNLVNLFYLFSPNFPNHGRNLSPASGIDIDYLLTYMVIALINPFLFILLIGSNNQFRNYES